MRDNIRPDVLARITDLDRMNALPVGRVVEQELSRSNNGLVRQGIHNVDQTSAALR